MEKNNNLFRTEHVRSFVRDSSQEEVILASSRETSSGSHTAGSHGQSNKKRESGSRKQQRDAKRRWMKPTVRKIKVLRMEKFEEAEKSKEGGLKIVHLGGLGEIGRNMSAIQYDDEIILIDAGISFPNEQMPGIDFILPNIGYLRGKEHMIKAMFFTHGHMDHIGALPFLLNNIGDPDFYASPLTRAMVMKRLEEYKDRKPVNIIQIEAGDEIKVSDKLSAKVLRVSHSIPDDLMTVIQTPVGKIVHTSDFKFDETPVNDKPAHIEEIERMGDAKEVLLMMSDSTGAENEGHSLSEQ